MMISQVLHFLQTTNLAHFQFIIQQITMSEGIKCFFEEPSWGDRDFLNSQESLDLLPSFSETNDSQSNSSGSQFVEGKDYNQQTPVSRKTDRRRSRVDNTTFKTSLSVFRKSLIELVSHQRELNWLRCEIKQVVKRKNYSVFPKLCIIAQETNLNDNVLNLWVLKTQSVLWKKEKLLEQGKYSENRFQQLRKTIKKMSLAIGAGSVKELIDQYWGDRIKQGDKYARSLKEVIEFQNSLKLKLKANDQR